MSKARPPLDEVPPFYHGYVQEAVGSDVCEALVSAAAAVQTLFGAIPEERGDHRYAPGKWSVKDVLLHLVDAERVFAYRALRFARMDGTPLPGFDEDAYVPAARADKRTLAGLLEEHRAVHASTLALFRSLGAEELLRTGEANGRIISVRAIGWATAGHALHHASVVRERYLG